MKLDTMRKFEALIVSIEFLHHEVFKGLELFKCKIILRDGSNLRILEKYRQGQLIYYSYYWLTASNELIVGWDNAPHHVRLKTFPHHKHLPSYKKPMASQEHNLFEVLTFIAGRLT